MTEPLTDPSRARVVRGPGETIASAVKGRKTVGTILFNDEFMARHSKKFREKL
jgi:hypothetical protein